MVRPGSSDGSLGGGAGLALAAGEAGVGSTADADADAGAGPGGDRRVDAAAMARAPPRSQPGAVLDDAASSVARARRPSTGEGFIGDGGWTSASQPRYRPNQSITFDQASAAAAAW